MGGFSGTANASIELARQTQKLSWTGDTTEKVLLTVTVPPMGINSYLEISSLFTYPNSANSKVMRVRLGGIGGSVIMQVNATTTASATDVNRKVLNRGATNSQVITNSQVYSGTSTGAVNTTAVETNAGTTLVFTVQNVTSGADTSNLEYAVVNLVM